MKRNKSKNVGSKAGSVFLIAILCLAGIGVAYAGLTDTISVFGSVSTARVQFENLEYTGTWVYKIWDCDNNNGPDNEIVVTDEPDFNPETEYPGCSWELVSWAYSEEGTGDYDVDVIFHNLMPGINYVADLHFNIGTIPVKVDKLQYTYSADSLLEGLVASGDIYGLMYTDTGKTVEVGTQIHPSERVSLELYIEIPQDNEYQGLSGSFTFEMGIVQWTDPCGYVPNPKGSIEVRKLTDPQGSNVDFDFTITGPDINEVFALKDGESNTFGNLDLGSYTVTETLPAGWQMYDIQISGDYTGKTTTSDSITFNLLEGHVVVTFVNEQKYVNLKATKIICPSVDCLPQGGNDPNHPPMITETLINDFLADNPDCTVDYDWEFEWAQQNVNDPITDYSDIPSQYGYGGSDWNTFTGEVSIDIDDITGNRVWIREVLEDGYIPFAGATDDPGDGSAELYAHTDVYNFDNYDYIDNLEAGETYYIVGFNVELKKPDTLVLPDWMEAHLKHGGVTESYWRVTIHNLPDNTPDVYSPPINVDEILRGWCVDQYATISEGNHNLTVVIPWEERENVQPGNNHAPEGITDWDCVDYIINLHRVNEYARMSVQKAIWYYVNGGNYPSDSDAQDIIADVEANAVDWVNAGRPIFEGLDCLWLAVLVDPGCGQQLTIIEVDP